MTNCEKMLSNRSAEGPYTVLTTGEFNCRSSKWWQGDTDNEEGNDFKPFSSDLGLHQLISEPPHIIHILSDSRSCIDINFTDQPNFFLKSGIHQSLPEQCHHQIVYGELCISNPIPPPYCCKISFYTWADAHAITKSIKILIGVNILAI